MIENEIINKIVNTPLSNPTSIYGVVLKNPVVSAGLLLGKREESGLILKLKRKKALRNKFVIILWMMVGIPIMLGVDGLVFWIVDLYSPSSLSSFAMLLGIVTAFSIIMFYMFLEKRIECDVNFVKVKYKNKVY